MSEAALTALSEAEDDVGAVVSAATLGDLGYASRTTDRRELARARRVRVAPLANGDCHERPKAGRSAGVPGCRRVAWGSELLVERRKLPGASTDETVVCGAPVLALRSAPSAEPGGRRAGSAMACRREPSDA